MIRLLYSTLLMLLFTNFVTAQNFKLEGNWRLDDVVITNFQDGENAITKENCFFSYYLDPINVLEINAQDLAINVGGENYLYNWQIVNHQLKLSKNNTVMLRKQDGAMETFQKEGETILDVQRKGKILLLSRTNENFEEVYTFSVAK